MILLLPCGHSSGVLLAKNACFWIVLKPCDMVMSLPTCSSKNVREERESGLRGHYSGVQLDSRKGSTCASTNQQKLRLLHAFRPLTQLQLNSHVLAKLVIDRFCRNRYYGQIRNLRTLSKQKHFKIKQILWIFY